MNDEEKRLRKNEYQRNLRANKIKPQSILVKPDLVIDTDTTPLHKKPKKAKKSILKDSSIITYTGKLRAFHLRMTGLPLSQDIINAIQGNDYDKKLYKMNLNIFMITLSLLSLMKFVLSLPSVKFLLKFLASLSSSKFSSPLKEILKKLKLLEEMIHPLNKMISSLLISKIYSLTPLNSKMIQKNYFSS